MLTIIILTSIAVSILYAGINAYNYKKMEGIRLSERPAPIMPQTPISMKHKLSYIIDWIIVITVLALLFSCSPMKSGFYTIKEIRPLNTVVLKEVAGDWHIPFSDTLKVGQKIYLTRTKKDSLINVW